MTQRGNEILKAVVEYYIKTAKPIGSKFLTDEVFSDYSPATIRNDMAELEKEGFIYQPHTSAGRIPSEKGYQYYLKNLLSVKPADTREVQELRQVYEQDVRDLAKYLVRKTNLAALVCFAPNSFYFTGLFNLFSQHEFEDYDLVLDVSQMIDDLEKTIGQIYNKVDEPKVLLGKENPVSRHCSVVVAPLPTQQRELLTILGPTRMDYNRVLRLMDEVIEAVH